MPNSPSRTCPSSNHEVVFRRHHHTSCTTSYQDQPALINLFNDHHTARALLQAGPHPPRPTLMQPKKRTQIRIDQSGLEIFASLTPKRVQVLGLSCRALASKFSSFLGKRGRGEKSSPKPNPSCFVFFFLPGRESSELWRFCGMCYPCMPLYFSIFIDHENVSKVQHTHHV